MYKKIIVICALIIPLLFSPTLFAHGCHKKIEDMMESLKLTDEQKAKIKPIVHQMKERIKEKVVQMKEVENQLHVQMVSPTMDQAAVDKVIDQKTTLIGDMIKAKVAAKHQIFTILTPEQKTQLQNKMQKVKKKMEKKFADCHDDD